MGGLLVKCMLGFGESDIKLNNGVDVDILRQQSVQMLRNTAGIIFFGTPHRGSPLADVRCLCSNIIV